MKGQEAGYIILCLAMLMLHASPAKAYPGYYAAKASSCTQIPASQGDLDGSPHGAPVRSNVTFEVKDVSTNSLVTNVCPGGSYSITLKLPVAGYHTIMTSTTGDFKDKCGGIDGCPNRACKCEASRSSGFRNCPASSTSDVTYNIKMPCDASLKGTQNVFQAAFIRNTNYFGAMEVSTYSVEFGNDCAACGGGGGDDQPTLKLKASKKSVALRRGANFKLEVEVQGVPPTGKGNQVTLSWNPSGAISCAARVLQLSSERTATTVCTPSKVGRVRVTARYAGLNATQSINVRPVLKPL